MAKADRKANRQAKREDARTRVRRRLKLGKNVNASKIAEKAGISERRAQKIIDRGGRKSTFAESQKVDTPVKTAEYQSGQQYYSDGKLVDMGPPNREQPGKDNNPYTVKNIQSFR